jgi:hypothetical protein
MSDFFENLMTDLAIPLIKEGGNIYAIRILSKGEDLFFRENDKALICTIDAVHGVIYKDSINGWDTPEKKMDNAEKERVVRLIYKFYKERLNPEVRVYEKVKRHWQEVSMD